MPFMKVLQFLYHKNLKMSSQQENPVHDESYLFDIYLLKCCFD